MGNFEKLGILVIIVLVVVILVLAVWGMEVQPSDDRTMLKLEDPAPSVGLDGKARKDIVEPDPDKDDKARVSPWPFTDPVDPQKEPPVKPVNEIEQPVEPPVAKADLVHVVAKNDNFNSLARKYYGDIKYWPVIQKANPDVNPNRMQLGVKLVIPHPDTVLAKATAPNRPATPVANVDRTPAGRTYTVRKGDNLRRIAERELGSRAEWQKLYEANRDKIGPDPDRLDRGMVLVLP